MKTLPLMLAVLLGITTTSIEAVTTASTTNPGPKPTTQEFNILVVQTNPAVTPTTKTVFSGKDLFLVGTAVEPAINTKVECCANQHGKGHIPLTKTDDLKAYDITGDGKVDQNEAGYRGLLVGQATSKDNVIKTVTFKEAGIKSITLPTATNQTPVVEFSNQQKTPVQIIKIVPTK